MTDQQDIIPPARLQRPSIIRNLRPRLPERGHIKIGGLGETRKSRGGNDYQLPIKYDHFKITTLERGEDGNFVLDEALHDKLGLGDCPTEIPIRLLYDDPTLSLQSRYACYAGKQLWCSGDGVEALRASKEYGKPKLSDPFKVQCPCHRQDPAYTGDDRCKMNGRLSTIIDGAQSVGGIWVFRTTSYNSITGLMSSLLLLHTLTGGVLANIPLKLTIQPKRVNSPVDGKAQTVYVVSVEFAGDIEELQETGHKIALRRATAHVSIAHIEDEARRLLALPMAENAVLQGDEPDAIVSEFYPEQNGPIAGEAMSPPPRPTREQFVEPPKQPASEPIITYALITADGVEEDVPGEKLVDRMTEVFIAASNLGYPTWKGVVDTNAPLIQSLKAGSQTEIAWAEQISDACRSNAPAIPGRSKQATTTPAESMTPADITGRKDGATSRPSLWQQESFMVDTPTKADRSVNWPILRDVLMYAAAQAETPAELAKFIADNEPQLRRLREAVPQYESAVQATFMAVGKRLSSADAA